MRGLREYWRSFRRTALEKTSKLELKLRGLLGKGYDYSDMSPTEFAERILKVKPFPYQKAVLEDPSKRLVACMGRQSGKTTTIAMRAIHFAYTNPSVTVLITAPSLRQSMIMFDRISTFIFGTAILKNHVVRSTRTIIQLDNKSQIIALPCSEHFLRGYTAHMVICFPRYVKVTLANGQQVPISNIKPGQEVLSFNASSKKIEPRKVLRVFRSPFNGNLIRVVHKSGCLDCTPEHKIITVDRGHISAMLLSERDKLLYFRETNELENAPRQAANPASRTVPLWRAFRRFLPFKNNEKRGKEEKEQLLKNSALLKTSRIRSIQILDNERFCQNPTTCNKKQGLGKGISKVLHACISCIHKGTSNLLQRWPKNRIARVACEDNPSVCLSNLVHGRWKPSSQFNDDYKHARILTEGTRTSQEMAGAAMGVFSKNSRGQKGERLLSAFSGEGEGQVLRPNPSIRNSKHETQDPTESGASSLLRMWKTLYSEKKRRCNDEDNEKEYLLQSGLPQNFLAKTVQSSTNPLYSMWKRVHSTCRKKNDLQSGMRRKAPFTIQEGLQTRENEALGNKGVCHLWTNFQAEKNVPENLQPRMQRKISPYDGESEEEIVVYNLEVEGNHNYFANGVLVGNCDEASFMPEELITQVLFPMISTTDGYAIMLSTPWGRDHFFYRAFMDPNYSVHRVKSSECPLIKPEFLEEMRRNMTEQAFRMEYMAEFVEAANAYFTQDLIRGCVDPTLEFISSLETEVPAGEYYSGCDLGKLQDFSVITVLKREGDLLRLVYLMEFPIGTPYTNVMGHLIQADRKFRFRKVLVDQTGVGVPVLEELKEQGMQNVEGLVFTVRTKEELLSCLKIAMEQQRLKMPYHRRLAQQMNEQQYEYSKSGHLTFSHPTGSHDDMLWSLALACYVATIKRPAPSRLVRAY